MTKKMTYAGVGVDYDAMDPFKRMAQKAARETAGNIARLGLSEFEPSRGESTYLIETADSYLAHVEEGLGTKNIVADAMYKPTGRSYYECIAQDTVAMIVNDLVTLGALPISVAMHLAVGDSAWFKDEQRCRDLVDGWKNACNMARCVWGGGETPTLKGLPYPVLAGSAMGIVKPKERLLSTDRIRHGDAIVLVESSGIHANGLSLAREIAGKLPRGYFTELCDGRLYGESLLVPTRIYVDIVEDLLDADIDLHYAVNITGHGWRKLMRAPQPFTYVIARVPEPQPVFHFIQQHGPVDDYEMYGNFNMGAGFALYLSEGDALRATEIIGAHHRCMFAGYVENGPKQVIIQPKRLTYEAKTLQVR